MMFDSFGVAARGLWADAKRKQEGLYHAMAVAGVSRKALAKSG
jgi:hypothetical protein